MDQPKTKPSRSNVKHRVRLPAIIRRFPLIGAALLVALLMVGGSLLYARSKKQAQPASGSFNTAKVLPQAVTIPPAAANKTFTADNLKQYDGKNGHKCYVAVGGTVYEIAGKSLWQNGQHTPSSGQAYCGADLTEAIKKSPHGASKLEELPKVGSFKVE